MIMAYNYARTDFQLSRFNLFLLLCFSDEGILRIYLRGRAVSMFAPSDYGDFQITKPLPAPSEKLKLEWAYPLHIKLYFLKMH